MQHIHCTVDNCFYWEQGNICLAKEIVVTTDQVGAQYPESLDANVMKQLSSEVGTTPAEDCMATCCKTFYFNTKGSGPVPKISRSQYPTS